MQRWDSWLEAMRGVDQRLRRELEASRAQGDEKLEIVLSGRHTWRAWALAHRTPRWRRLVPRRDPLHVLALALGESEPSFAAPA